jgi:leucine-rich repeat protein SHOC2
MNGHKVILPAELGNLRNLQNLSLGYDIPEIPSWVWTLDNLETLSICNDSIESIPAEIAGLKRLRELRIYSEKIARLPKEIGEKLPLTGLNLQCPKLEALPDSFANLKTIKRFSFTLCNLTAIPGYIYDWTNLEEFELSMANSFQGPYTKLKTIPKNIGNLRKLRYLNLGGGSITKIPDSLGNCPLIHLNLSGDFSIVPETMGNCKNLKRVFIDSDKLTALPESFCKLQALEELRLNTFALKALPSAFGSLSSLKSLDIFSGALTTLPESIGGLKNLVNLRIDAHNVIKLPESFKKLSYIKEPVIEIGQNEPVFAQKKKGKAKKNSLASFEELSAMSWQYRSKLFEAYSIEQLETLICSAPKDPVPTRKDKELFKDIMFERQIRLRSQFKWNEENIKRIVKVSDEFIKAWEDGFSRAKLIVETLYEKSQGKTFQDKYIIEITLYPEILFSEDGEISDWELYNNITRYLYSGVELNMQISYDPVTKNEDDFWENGHVNRDLSWNIEGFGDNDLEGYYICYALHILYSHNHWAFQDIPRINHILTEIKVSCYGENF